MIFCISFKCTRLLFYIFFTLFMFFYNQLISSNSILLLLLLKITYANGLKCIRVIGTGSIDQHQKGRSKKNYREKSIYRPALYIVCWHWPITLNPNNFYKNGILHQIILIRTSLPWFYYGRLKYCKKKLFAVLILYINWIIKYHITCVICAC